MIEKKAENSLVENININFEEDMKQGFEEADSQCYAIPFLSILQPLSPQIATNSIEGAKSGDIFNTLTNELFKEISVIPCAFQRRYIAWQDDTRGGLRGIYTPLEIENRLVEYKKDEDGKMWIGDCVLVDTRMHYVLYKSANDSWEPAVIAMSSTQVKKSKRWFYLMQSVKIPSSSGKMINPATYSHIYKLNTEQESNNKGYWYSWSILGHQLIKDVSIYMRAREFYDSVIGDKVELSQPSDAFDHDF